MVGSEEWKNEHIAHWRTAGSKQFGEAEEFRKNNPVGKRIQLLYNPSNPFDSLLNGPRTTDHGPRNPAVGTATAVFGLAVIVFGLINWMIDPTPAGQFVLIAGGTAVSISVATMSRYPFERPWWFEMSEDDAAEFMRNAQMVKAP